MRRICSALALTLLLAGCGGGDDDKDTAPASTPTTAAEAQAAAGKPQDAIQAYFTAQREGATQDICDLETEALKTTKYDTAEACLQDASNTRPQPVWADPVVIVSLEESGDSATGTLQPNAGSDAQATISLTLEDGAWKVSAFR